MPEEEKISRYKFAKQKAKDSAKKLRKEFNKALTTAIVAAFGFLMALAWRDAITEYVNKIAAASPIQGKLITALIVTIVSVIGIIIITSLLSENTESAQKA